MPTACVEKYAAPLHATSRKYFFFTVWLKNSVFVLHPLLESPKDTLDYKEKSRIFKITRVRIAIKNMLVKPTHQYTKI